MTEARITISSPELVPALERNLAFAWTSLRAARGIAIEERAECVTHVTGLPAAIMNGVHCARLPADDAAIKRVLEPFVSRGLPMVWSVGPSDTPSDLGERLLGMGLKGPDTTPGMAVDLSLLGDEPLPAGFEISAVTTPEDWNEYGRVLCEGFSMPTTLAEPFAAIVKEAYASGEVPVRAFIGRLNGSPVATSQVLMQHGVAGIYNITTLAEARGKGIGRAITLAACLYGKREGYAAAILQSSSMGHPVYLRMGFEDRCEIVNYACLPG